MLPVAYRTLPAEEGLKPDRRRLIRESQRESC
jgi:hypothetical protein